MLDRFWRTCRTRSPGLDGAKLRPRLASMAKATPKLTAQATMQRAEKARKDRPASISRLSARKLTRRTSSQTSNTR